MAAGAAAVSAAAGGALPGGVSNNASLRLPQMPNTNPLLTAAAKAAAASGGINLPLPWPQNMRPKEAMPISPPLTPLPATMRFPTMPMLGPMTPYHQLILAAQYQQQQQQQILQHPRPQIASQDFFETMQRFIQLRNAGTLSNDNAPTAPPTGNLKGPSTPTSEA